ncbi:class I SAM-dependent methyltransferase [Myxococcota bacterium]|nr:class I SAM-dependent methyltransferase [Myxococcota bacterium]
MPLVEPNETRRLRLMAERARGDRLLDIGFAQIPNHFLRGAQVVGFDLVSRPAEPPYTRTVAGDAAHMTDLLPASAFDTVLAGEIVEHVDDPYRFLRDCRTLLAPGGRLVLSTPNPLHPPIWLAEWLRLPRFYYTREHRHYILPRWVHRMLDLSGFVPVEDVPVGFMVPLGHKPAIPCLLPLSYQVIYVAEPRR